MINRVKNHIRKYILKYIPVICTLLFVPILSISSFAYTLPYNSYDFYNKSHLSMACTIVYDGGKVGTATRNHDPDKFNTPFAITKQHLNVTQIDYTCDGDSGFELPFDFEKNNYYISFAHTTNHSSTGYEFVPTDFYLLYYDSSGVQVNVSLNIISQSSMSSNQVDGIMLIAEIPFIPSSNLLGMRVTGLGTIYTDDLWSIASFVYEFPKSDGNSTQDIITAINNQTSSLGGKLDGIDSGIDKGNDLIENGTDETQQAVTDFNEVFEDFNTQLEEIESFETQFTDDFNTANETYLNELSQFTMPYGVINAGNWLSTSMQTVYDNANDYKMLWLVPLLLGVPLVIFFFKRGDNSE